MGHKLLKHHVDQLRYRFSDSSVLLIPNDFDDFPSSSDLVTPTSKFSFLITNHTYQITINISATAAKRGKWVFHSNVFILFVSPFYSLFCILSYSLELSRKNTYITRMRTLCIISSA